MMLSFFLLFFIQTWNVVQVTNDWTVECRYYGEAEVECRMHPSKAKKAEVIKFIKADGAQNPDKYDYTTIDFTKGKKGSGLIKVNKMSWFSNKNEVLLRYNFIDPYWVHITELDNVDLYKGIKCVRNCDATSKSP